MTDAERAAFRTEVRAYLLENPEVLMRRSACAEPAPGRGRHSRDGWNCCRPMPTRSSTTASWVGGNPEGDITLVEFMDYRCGYCRKAHDEVAELVEIRRQHPLHRQGIPDPRRTSILSARFAIAVRQLHGDETYKAAHDALITLRGDPRPKP
jgi:hypothetical protein